MNDHPITDTRRLAGPEVAHALQSALAAVRVLARRLVLVTPGVEATVPMLRGVWGAALHDRDPESYATVFDGQPQPTGAETSRVEKRPLFVLRPAPPHPDESPAVEWISLAAAVDRDAALLEAWMEAAARGLGPGRVPMSFRAVRGLGPDGRTAPRGAEGCFTLDAARWPLPGIPETTPCRLRFDVPLRVMRKGLLITEPTLTDIALAGLRRLSALSEHDPQQDRLTALRSAVLDVARGRREIPWRGERAHLSRYSANQGEMHLRGVTGHLDLPEGPGPLWPLLAALCWVHVGKGTVFGLGHLVIEPLIGTTPRRLPSGTASH